MHLSRDCSLNSSYKGSITLKAIVLELCPFLTKIIKENDGPDRRALVPHLVLLLFPCSKRGAFRFALVHQKNFNFVAKVEKWGASMSYGPISSCNTCKHGTYHHVSAVTG